MSSYPESDKVLAVAPISQQIGEFLDWLPSQNLHLCQWRDEGNNGEPKTIPATEEGLAKLRDQEGYTSYRRAKDLGQMPNPDYFSWGEGYEHPHISITTLLARYFKIDMDKVEEERKRMLERLREQAGGEA